MTPQEATTFPPHGTKLVTPAHQARWCVLITIGVVAALAGGEIAVWKGGLEDRVAPKRWGVVEPGAIYRSGQSSRHVIRQALAEHGIKVIVDLTSALPDDPDQSAELAAAAALGIEHHRLPLRGDGTGDITRYADALALIVAAKQAGKPVLVHCAAGSQRTGGAVAFYRLLVQHWTPDRALVEMKQYDHDPHDNPALLPYLNQHMRQMANLLVERGVIRQVPDPPPQFIVDSHR